MCADGDRLLALALSVSDGTAVDWDAAERAAASDSQRDAVRQMRAVAALSSFADSLQSAPAHAAERPSPPARSWGPLEILERLGGGAFGEVFRARDPRLDTEVALKLLAPGAHSGSTAQRSVIEEGRLLARVRHPHVVSVYGADEHDGRVGIWMELVRGKTLADLMRETGPLGAREAASIGSDLCAALAAIHGAGLLHRDVKAQNVMRADGGRIVLMDLGAGVDLGAADARAALDSLTGTPLYMAPEMLRGSVATVRTDIYALGVLLFHLASRRFPVEGRSLRDVLRRHQTTPPLRLRDLRSDLPASFITAVDRALDPDPERRWHSAGEFDAALQRALETPGAASPGAAAPRRGVAFGFSLGPLKLTLAASFALVLLALVGVFYEPQSPGALRVPTGLDPTHALQPAPVDNAPPADKLAPLPASPAGFALKAQLGERGPDQATLLTSATAASWIYVLAQDSRGVWRVLHQPAGPSVAGATHAERLPLASTDRAWLVVATRERWVQLDAQPSDATLASALAAARLDPHRFQMTTLALTPPAETPRKDHR